MKSFSQYLAESQSETATMTWGRFQCPTIGHEKLFNAIKSEARGSDYFIYTSQTQNSSNDPLGYVEKVTILKKMFPEYASHIILNRQVVTIFDAVIHLYKAGYKNLRLVVGSDRVSHFQELLNKYNGGPDYKFYSVDVVSAGDRDPDGDEASAMSASKMRAAVRADDFGAFKKGLPKTYADKEQLFDLLKQRMHV